jgi:hypothetical protein
LFYTHLWVSLVIGLYLGIDVALYQINAVEYMNPGQRDIHNVHPGQHHVFSLSITIGMDELVSHPERIPTCDFAKDGTPLAESNSSRHLAAHLGNRTYFLCNVGGCHVIKCGWAH